MKRFILGLLFAGIAFPVSAMAQDGPQRGQLMELTTFNVEPSQAPAFEAAVKQVVKAATDAKAKSAWHFWTEGWRYVLAYPVPNFAYFDDPLAFQKQFAGTPGEAGFQQAMQEMTALAVRVSSTELVESVPGWEYEPATAPQQFYFGQVHEFWVKPGKNEQFNALVKEIMAFFAEVGYSYEVIGHRVHFGDPGRAAFITLVDDMSEYYGAKSLERLAQQRGAAQKWQGLVGRLAALIDRSDDTSIRYRSDLSFMPAPSY